MEKNRGIQLIPIFICSLAALFYLYDYFIQVMPSVMTQELMREFSINAVGLSILGSCFYYSYMLMQIPAGMLLDKFGARITLTTATFISALGVILFGQSHSLLTASIARLLIGFGSAFSFISVLYLAARWFSHKRFALIAGLTQLTGSLGSIFGLAPIALLISYYSWQTSITTIGLITLGLALLFWVFIRNGATKQPQNSNAKTQISAFKYIIKKPQVWWIALIGFLSWAPVATIGALWGTPYIADVYNINTILASKICSLFWVGLAIGSPTIGWLSNRIQRRCLPISISFAIGCIAVILIIEATYLPIYLTGIALFLVGLSASVQSLSFGIIKDIVPHNIFATASGINNMAAILGGAIAQMSVGFILSLLWQGRKIANSPVFSTNSYRIAFTILLLSALFGLIVTVWKIKETHCKQIHSA